MLDHDKIKQLYFHIIIYKMLSAEDGPSILILLFLSFLITGIIIFFFKTNSHFHQHGFKPEIINLGFLILKRFLKSHSN